jgi:hypothetical protein
MQNVNPYAEYVKSKFIEAHNETVGLKNGGINCVRRIFTRKAGKRRALTRSALVWYLVMRAGLVPTQFFR